MDEMHNQKFNVECTYKSDGVFEISNHKLRKRPFKFRGKNVDAVIDFLEKLREQMREFTATKIQRLEISSPAPVKIKLFVRV